MVVTKTLFSPHKETLTRVVIADPKTLARVLPTSTTPNKRSGRLSKLRIKTAERFFERA